MKPGYRILVFLLLTTFAGRAQQFGGLPPWLKWKQIDTDTVRLIFTEGAEEEANRIATLIHRTTADTAFAIGSKLKKINIVMHSHTTLANGYVALAPFKSEFYLVPSSNVFEFGNLPWYENLAIHEFRHVQQYNNFRNGLAKGFYYLFGEQGLALANAMAVPDWFFEGDAVHSETAYTTQGRGRLPNFLSGYNSLWLEGKSYSWLKLRNGSLKDYVPDHYHLGYLLVNYGYLKYGKDFWKNVTHDASGFKGLFYPFQKGIKKYAGLDYRTFRNQAFDFYKQKLRTVEKAPVNKTKTVTNYYFAQWIGSDSLLYLKSAYNKLPAFYIRDKAGEHRIARQDISSEDWFSYVNGKIAYTAYSTHPRWGLVDYSDIIVMDLKTHRETKLTKKHKYFTPDLSPSGTKIIAVCVTDSLQTELHLLDASTGAVEKTIKNSNFYFTNPRFIDKDRIVVGTRTEDARMALQSYDLETGSWQQLTPFTSNFISHPFVFDNTIYFTSNINGNDDVYVLRLKDKKIYQLTTGLTGNYYPSANKDSLIWSHFTAEGLQLKKEALNKLNWAEVSGINVQEERILYPVALEKNILGVKTERFAVKRYSKSTGLLHFHSWAPNYNDPEFTFSLYSDNILNTFSNELFYRYNQNESSHGVGWNASYSQFYPQINAGLEYTFDRHLNIGNSRLLSLNQYEARIGYSIPLNLTRGKTYKFLNFGSNYVFNHAMPTGVYKDSLQAESISYLHHFINWSHYIPMARQHIYPKLGYTVSVAHRHVLNGTGFQFISHAQLFLPSFGNHSIVLTASWQERDTSSIVFSNRFAVSRGYNDYDYSRMWRVSANYHFPIAYPDFGIASIVYLQRLRGNIFYDHSRFYYNDKLASANLRSFGAELYFDTKWWNQQPITFGVRVSHLLDNFRYDRRGDTWFEVILPLNLIPN